MKLRLLLIEDSEDDARLLLRTLSQAGVEVDVTRVDCRPDLEDAIKKPGWDAVVSDFNLPGVTAFDALEALKRTRRDVPFIVVSGSVGEETAVECMKAGAHDYVMKSSLARLPESLRREVREAGQRKERAHLEQQLRQAQKMEVVGQLASGVAHDFNNLLTVIINFTQFVHDELPEEHSGRKDLSEVVDCGNRAAMLTRQLLSFSRKSVNEPKLMDLNELVRASERMLVRVLGQRIDFAASTHPESCCIVADRSGIEQVLMNLVVNARDAMPDGGKLTVETTVEADRVMLAVTDTGCGMAPEVQARVFEPFFTTKTEGRGTGLGLATVQGIVKECGGEILVHSTPGAGSTFKVYLKRAQLRSNGGANAESTEALRGTETVLVLDDEDAVRVAAARMLRSHGYNVLEASRPREALALLEAAKSPVHLLLSDLAMADMTGVELAVRAQKRDGALAAVVMSGFGGAALARHGLVDPGVAFLQKPFSGPALLRKVRATLDGAVKPSPLKKLKRVLFVDDEPMVLRALQNLLRSQRHVWEMVFVNSAQAALAELAKAPFDVVVSDMRMPEIDGAQLLQQVNDQWPGVERIVLSGYSDPDAIDRAKGVVHKWLHKPCKLDELRTAIDGVLEPTAKA